ncbi:GNAT family N-acetyltransferase [Enterovibrio norvegicus FF-162]|uniref:GNAT family N-acetyltransferase n=1 Tax=Enterovibrio TaxID=188143 RepID=UPI0002D778B3|nr:GNAT family N-acetyltransferase [Enterovibrio norvegicus]OEE80064.1 GNAT family N-acetyltransferase [Enterovibrio norvegicus FF-162]
MLLVPFEAADAPQLCGWIPNARDNYLWGGPAFEFPITVEQVAAHLAKPEVRPFLFRHQGEAVGYIELYRVSATEYRLCRVLIAAENSRGQGWGKAMVSMALDVAFEEPKITTVSLAVFECNQIAVACYTALGFDLLQEETKTREFQEETWTLLRMQKRR